MHCHWLTCHLLCLIQTYPLEFQWHKVLQQYWHQHPVEQQKLLLILLGLQKEFWSSYRHTGYWFLLCPVLGLYLQILGQVNAICMRSIICYVPKRKKLSACAQQLNQMLLLIQILKMPSLDWYCNIPNPNLNLWKLPSSTPFVCQLFMTHLFQLQQFALLLPNMIQINFSSSCVTNSCRAGQCSCSTMG